jgi:excinuclease ABC subunit C
VAGKAGRSGGRLSDELSTVPKRPGVYIFKDAGEKVLYVGKAKDLRSRMQAYFRKSASLDERKSSMMKKVTDYSFIVTENELEALALEANLIKQYRPRFNVLLRDDKNYPYLRLTLNEHWPRLEVVRRIANDGAEYFGPYVPAGTIWEVLSFVRKNFGLRPCRYRLDKPMRPCIQYQMGRCPAPCADLAGHEEYMCSVREAGLFLKGRKTELLDELRKKMQRLSGEMNYEEAAGVRDRLAALDRALESQKVISAELGDIDVIGSHACGDEAVFQVFFIRGGVMIGARDYYLKGLTGISPKELARSFVMMFYSGEIIPPGEILMGESPDDLANLREWLGRVRVSLGTRRKAGDRITVPRRGKRLELLHMAEENARLIYEGRKESGHELVVEELRKRLLIGILPRSIGAFDVSNFTGDDPVGAYVCWSEGEFRKDLYRRIRIKSVGGIDDYGMMRETVGRVLSMIDPPDLIVVDGGRGHLEAAVGALRSVQVNEDMSASGGGGLPPEVVAVAKKPDRLFSTRFDEPISLDDRGPSSVLLRSIRDEAHRFAIGYHKKLRQRRLMRSPLEDIPGVGRKRRLALLRHFSSLEAVMNAPAEELARVPGINLKVAESIRNALKETQ